MILENRDLKETKVIPVLKVFKEKLDPKAFKDNRVQRVTKATLDSRDQKEILDLKVFKDSKDLKVIRVIPVRKVHREKLDQRVQMEQ